MNVNMRKISTNKPNGLPNRYYELLSSYSMTVINDYTTRPASQSVIDHIVSNIHEDFNIENNTIENDIADHNAIFSV